MACMKSADEADEKEKQDRIRSEVMKVIGTIHGGDPDRAENASSEVRLIIARKNQR
jgi:hypothetical protein